MILASHLFGGAADNSERWSGLGMNSRQMSLLLFTLMLFPTQSESKRTPTTATGEQSGFNYELEIDPIQKPVALPTEALLVLAKDKHVGSCLSSQV
jgi:hypothetical protein